MPVLIREDSHRQVVLDTLTNIKENSKDAEFVVIDDGSPLLTGFTRDFATTYIRHEKPMGIAPSWNDGMAVARGEYLVFINDDILVCPGWLEAMNLAFSQSNCGVSGPMHAGPLVTPMIVTGTSAENYKFFPGYCFMVSREAAAKIGKFDETFVPYNGEDTDYWERALQADYKLYQVPLAIWHKEGDVVHTLGDYRKNSEIANKRFKTKHGFDPISKFYS